MVVVLCIAFDGCVVWILCLCLLCCCSVWVVVVSFWCCLLASGCFWVLVLIVLRLCSL